MTARRHAAIVLRVLAAVADIVVAVAWGLVLAPGLGGHETHGAGRLARLGFLVLLGTGVWQLERMTGGVPARTAPAVVVGLGLALGGVLLHRRARRALGPAFATAVVVPADRTLVRDGPYARVRHPLYGAVLLLLAGTVLVHPSVATGCLALGLVAGVALKIRREDALLRQALGARWTEYARRVPALVPRLRRAAPS